MEHKDTGEFIGFIGRSVPRRLRPISPCVEIGWRLARRFWGLGFATDGARACLDVGFGRLGLTEVMSFTALANRPSRAVMTRIGRPCSARCALISSNSALVRSLASSSRLNLSSVVASGTDSRERSMPTKSRSAWLSYSASSGATSAKNFSRHMRFVFIAYSALAKLH